MWRRLISALAAFKFAWDAYPHPYVMGLMPEDAEVCFEPVHRARRDNFTIVPDDFEHTALVEFSEYRNLTKH